jgi:sugar phosphate isomerase/epimerase
MNLDMQLNNYPDRHLTYCTNIHPGEEWEAVFNQLKKNIPPLKQRLAPEAPFGIGLRISAIAARQLRDDENLSAFKEWLNSEELYVFTINGFPYGSFHGTVVKDKVYKPDWTTSERLDYTLDLIAVLDELLPEGMEGGISTSPLSYKYWIEEDDKAAQENIFARSTEQLAKAAKKMADIRNTSGKMIHLDIEPEPDCLLENTAETVAFFTDWLFPVGSKHLGEEYGMEKEQAVELLRNHIRVCYDTCHFAVEYESPESAIQAFEKAGIRIGKTQISAALKARFETASQRKALIQRLQEFEEDTYLHQVVERNSAEALKQYRDLPDAFITPPEDMNDKNSVNDVDKENDTNTVNEPTEWRIHYHVPIFADAFNGMESTRNEITESLDILLNETDCTHFEIETYTWNVLPDYLKMNITDSIEREYTWVIAQISHP